MEPCVREGLFPILFGENLGRRVWNFDTDTFESRCHQWKQFGILDWTRVSELLCLRLKGHLTHFIRVTSLGEEQSGVGRRMFNFPSIDMHGSDVNVLSVCGVDPTPVDCVGNILRRGDIVIWVDVQQIRPRLVLTRDRMGILAHVPRHQTGQRLNRHLNIDIAVPRYELLIPIPAK